MNDTEKASLAHEKGSGAPCLKCGPKCEGLDLHFWRKTCKNCRCKEEEHQIPAHKLDIQQTVLKNAIPKRSAATVNGDNEGLDKKLTTAPKTKNLDDNSNTMLEVKGTPKMFPDGISNREETEIVKGITQLAVKDNDQASNDARENQEQDIAAMKMMVKALEDLDTGLVTKYVDALPKDKALNLSEDGMQYRQKQLHQQLPAHDFDENLCDGLTDNEKEKMKEFNKKRNEEASGQGTVKEQPEHIGDLGECVKCNAKFEGGEVVISADRAGQDKRWHPECFVCHTCDELLVDLIYFYKDGNVYCGRHYGELAGLRCAACDELIFTQEYTIAADRNYHMKHFCCYECDKELGGQSYVPIDDNPHCMDCYRVKFSKTCQGCQNSIPPDSECLGYEEFYWHANKDCFCCCVCKTNLVGQQFVFKNMRTFCSGECVANAE